MINEPEDLNLGEENDLYEHFRFIVDKGQALLRIDKFLQSKLPSISRNKIQNAAHAGSILVNGAAIKPNHKVHPSDIISIVLTVPPRETDIIPEDLPIEIVYRG